jgi:hypothetical protein
LTAIASASFASLKDGIEALGNPSDSIFLVNAVESHAGEAATEYGYARGGEKRLLLIFSSYGRSDVIAVSQSNWLLSR